MTDSLFELGHETIEIALSLGAIPKRADVTSFASLEIPQVVLAEKSLCAILCGRIGNILLAACSHSYIELSEV